MFCDVVFDHLVVMRHNGGCTQQVTTAQWAMIWTKLP